MRRIVVRNSLAVCCFLLLTIISSTSFLRVDRYVTSEIIGYTGMFLSLSLVYLAMRTYRNNVSGGTIRLATAFKIGLRISLIGALAFGIYSWIYYALVDPGFPDRYHTYLKHKVEANGQAGAEAARFLKEYEQMPEILRSPLAQSFLMFITVLVIGVAVSFMAAVIISRRKLPR